MDAFPRSINSIIQFSEHSLAHVYTSPVVFGFSTDEMQLDDVPRNASISATHALHQAIPPSSLRRAGALFSQSQLSLTSFEKVASK